MKIPTNATILADAKMHLPLYQKILDQKGNTLSIEVMTLHSFIASFFTIKQDEPLEILYQYKARLNSLSPNNSFYTSKEDNDFLQACLDFLTWASTYDLDFEKLPKDTKKEKDLFDVLTYIKDIPLTSSQTQALFKEYDHEDFSNVYILKKEFSDTEQLWVNFLIQKGAHYLENETVPELHYWSCANARMQATLVAKTILEENLNADDIQIALSNESDKQVLIQMLEAYQIPYTLLSESTISSLPRMFCACLNWIKDQSLDSFLKLIHTLYPNAQFVIDFYTIFPHAFLKDLSFLSIDYEDNNLIDQTTFETYVHLKEQSEQWLEEHRFLFTWSIEHLEEIIEEIKTQHPQLSKSDYSILRNILDLIIQARPYLKEINDLELLVNAIEQLNISTKPENYQGVLIGSRSDLTCLKDIVFMLSIHAKEFPKLSLKTGIFDENYIRKTNLPSLRSRIDAQNKQIFECMSQCKQLYVLSPQSTYQSKKLETSMQMDAWARSLGKTCEFHSIKDHSIFTKPEFSLSKESAQTLFLKNNHFKGSVSRLEAFARCPFQHFLRYGLYLNETKDWGDIRVRGTILHHILEKLATLHQKNYTNVEESEIYSTVAQEFDFARKLFPNKSKWCDIQVNELVHKVKLILEQLADFETNWHMNIDKQEYQFTYSMPWQDMTIELYGFIDRIDTSNTSFCIFDYKSSDKELTLDSFKSGQSLQLVTYTLAYHQDSNKVPFGSFYISLKTSPMSQTAYSRNYRKKIPELIQNEEKDVATAFLTDKKLKGWAYQDIEVYTDTPKKFATKKDMPTWTELKDMHTDITGNLIDDLLSGNILADHDSTACTYCSYLSICRNGRNEITKPSRLKEDE